MSTGLIAQELMTGEGCFDLDADVYVDTISHEPVAIFSKKKISTTIGGANKTISFKDERLFAFVLDAFKCFKFNGPLDADFFYKDGCPRSIRDSAERTCTHTGQASISSNLSTTTCAAR